MYKLKPEPATLSSFQQCQCIVYLFNIVVDSQLGKLCGSQLSSRIRMVSCPAPGLFMIYKD